MKNNNSLSKETIKKVIGTSKTDTPITLQTFKTNSIAISKRIIIELDNLENIIQKTEKLTNLNKIIITSVRLSLILEDIKSIKHDYLEK